MNEQPDDHFFNFEEFEKSQPDPMDQVRQQELEEAFRNALKAHITRKYFLEEDEIKTLIGDDLEKLRDFVKDREKIARDSRKRARLLEDEDCLDDGDEDDEDMPVAEIALSDNDKAHAKSRQTQAEKSKDRQHLKRHAQREKVFGKADAAAKPSPQAFDELLDLITCADEDPEKFDENIADDSR